jgi:nitrate/TMAO reductase-like tetraheme cytochrome c subunit
MDEEQKVRKAPPRYRYILIKTMTLTVLFLALLFVIGFSGLKATSSSKFCSSCHEMTPEYYTWKASAHAEVDCVNCHIEPGAKNLAKDKANGLVQVFDNLTNRYTAPIQMPKNIPNSACERCHNMKTREVTPSGDLIIPHDKHLTKGIKCVECHSGVAHGKIAERNVTFKTDYSKWDDSLGKAMMSDVTFTQPKMQDCMDCHKARGVSTACTTCHSTGMKPESHNAADFKNGGHGVLAGKDIKECNNCHQYMSDTEIKEIKDPSPTELFLNGGKSTQQTITAQEYAKENSFCKQCHTKRPPSHVSGWSSLHGPIATKDLPRCLTCHDQQNTGFNKISNVTCSSCHPAMHAGKDYKKTHPIDLTGVTEPKELCYSCHDKPVCTKCHK